jgi:hypothetical protein
MATEQDILEESLMDEEIDQIANEIAMELEGELSEKAQPEAGNSGAADASPSKPGDGGNGSAPEQAQVGQTATLKGKKLSKKKVKAEVKTKGQGEDPAELEVFEDEEFEGEELPESKQEMIRSIFETLKNTDQDKLAGDYAKLMATLLDESEGDDEYDQVAPVVYERTVVTAEDIDISEDLTAIFGSNDLSEEFKSQVQTVFEAAVVSKINEELESLEESFNVKLAESTDEIVDTVTEKVDSYLGYVVEEWMQENELAVERGIKAEITEEFIGGLKQLFEDHYIDVPEEKVDVVDSLADRVEDLESKLNESIETNINLSATVKEFQKDEVVSELSDQLTDIQSEKLRGLSEGVGFEDVDQYKEALSTIKENYFPRTTQGRAVVVDEEFEVSENGIVDEAPQNASMSRYVNTIGRTVVE